MFTHKTVMTRLTLEHYLVWHYDLIVTGLDSTRTVLAQYGMASVAEDLTVVSKEDFKRICHLFEPYRCAIETWLSEFDPSKSNWADYCRGVPVDNSQIYRVGYNILEEQKVKSDTVNTGTVNKFLYEQMQGLMKEVLELLEKIEDNQHGIRHFDQLSTIEYPLKQLVEMNLSHIYLPETLTAEALFEAVKSSFKPYVKGELAQHVVWGDRTFYTSAMYAKACDILFSAPIAYKAICRELGIEGVEQ